MRLVISCGFLLGLLLALDAPRRRSVREKERYALATLRAFVGVDLSKLSEDDERRLVKQVAVLLPNRHYPEDLSFVSYPLGYHPRRVWRTESGATLLIENDRDNIHPGYTRLRATVFDPAGAMVAESEFKTGWRNYLRDVILDTTASGDLPSLEITITDFTASGIARQFYAPIGGRYELIRFEHEEGFAVRNPYYVRHFRCGPVVPQRSAAAWVEDVSSADRNRVLRALVWLGGYHLLPQPGDKLDEQYESRTESDLVRRVRANPRVIERLKELSASEDHWLREAAILAANPKDERRW